MRNAVLENRLSNPDYVTDADCEAFLLVKGKGWVCEVNRIVLGFAIADLQENNIWSLFVTPAFAQKGIGKTLHAMMLKWYFEQTQKKMFVWVRNPIKGPKLFTKKQVGR